MEDGVLMRRWCPDNSIDSDWNVLNQIVVPACYRRTVLSLAHDHDLSGHLGIKKTYHRILKHFFWPRLKTDVAKYCRTCQTCQISGKPNQTIPHAPLVVVRKKNILSRQRTVTLYFEKSKPENRPILCCTLLL